MKTKEELNALKAEVEAVSRKLAELDGEELKEVTCGGIANLVNPVAGMPKHEAKMIAFALDLGTYEGAFATMTGAQFMGWWSKTNDEPLTPEDLLW